MEIGLDVEQRGTLVISVDFELHWGVRDFCRLDRAERTRLLAARRVIPRLLDLFEEFSISATWAIVGLLFARTKDEAEFFSPAKKPRYRKSQFDPYLEKVGHSETDDPFHFAPSLIADIASRRGQEIGSHSFSHYYCLEEGQTVEEFDQDLASALAIADQRGQTPRSYVFPRNQVNTAYLPALQKAGILTFRGTECALVKRASPFSMQGRPHRRMLRLLDSYLDVYGNQTSKITKQITVSSVPASRYLRPYNPFLRAADKYRHKRISCAMKYAAEQGEVFHLWWHPEDFAMCSDKNLEFLRLVLEAFDSLRRGYGMSSASMLGVVNKETLRHSFSPDDAKES